MKELIAQLQKLVNDWDEYANSNIPEEYTSRNLEYKFLRGNNIYAGYSDCADQLRDILDAPNKRVWRMEIMSVNISSKLAKGKPLHVAIVENPATNSVGLTAKEKQMTQLCLFEDYIKITVKYDGKRFFATAYDWFYATGDTAKQAVENIKKRMEKEIGHR